MLHARRVGRAVECDTVVASVVFALGAGLPTTAVNFLCEGKSMKVTGYGALPRNRLHARLCLAGRGRAAKTVRSLAGAWKREHGSGSQQ